MFRVAILGNAGGGKSTLARALADRHDLPLTEVDALYWRPGWVQAPPEDFARAHDAVLETERWILDGFGPWDAVERRLARATHVILVDLPLWVHFWLAAERQIAWAAGSLEHAPAGGADPPETKALFEMIWKIDQDWMPRVRDLVDDCARAGTAVLHLRDLDAVERLAATGLKP